MTQPPPDAHDPAEILRELAAGCTCNWNTMCPMYSRAPELLKWACEELLRLKAENELLARSNAAYREALTPPSEEKE